MAQIISPPPQFSWTSKQSWSYYEVNELAGKFAGVSLGPVLAAGGRRLNLIMVRYPPSLGT